jgi:hypothetical protein
MIWEGSRRQERVSAKKEIPHLGREELLERVESLLETTE